MTEPTIDELIKFIKNRIECAWAIDRPKFSAILASLDRLKAIDAQPVPVEPEWIKSLLRQIKEREDDDANTPCQLLLVLAYACVNDFVHLQSALKLSQEEIHIVFDGPPLHESGRFVEVENASGKSIKVGEWEQRGEYWHLIIGSRK